MKIVKGPPETYEYLGSQAEVLSIEPSFDASGAGVTRPATITSFLNSNKSKSKKYDTMVGVL